MYEVATLVRALVVGVVALVVLVAAVGAVFVAAVTATDFAPSPKAPSSPGTAGPCHELPSETNEPCEWSQRSLYILQCWVLRVACA